MTRQRCKKENKEQKKVSTEWSDFEQFVNNENFWLFTHSSLSLCMLLEGSLPTSVSTTTISLSVNLFFFTKTKLFYSPIIKFQSLVPFLEFNILTRKGSAQVLRINLVRFNTIICVNQLSIEKLKYSYLCLKKNKTKNFKSQIKDPYFQFFYSNQEWKRRGKLLKVGYGQW